MSGKEKNIAMDLYNNYVGNFGNVPAGMYAGVAERMELVGRVRYNIVDEYISLKERSGLKSFSDFEELYNLADLNEFEQEIFENFKEFLEVITNNPSSLNNDTDGTGKTLLHIAAKDNDWDLLNFIIDFENLDLDVVDKEGNTAASIAARNHNLKFVGVLGDLDADLKIGEAKSAIARFLGEDASREEMHFAQNYIASRLSGTDLLRFSAPLSLVDTDEDMSRTITNDSPFVAHDESNDNLGLSIGSQLRADDSTAYNGTPALGLYFDCSAGV